MPAALRAHVVDDAPALDVDRHDLDGLAAVHGAALALRVGQVGRHVHVAQIGKIVVPHADLLAIAAAEDVRHFAGSQLRLEEIPIGRRGREFVIDRADLRILGLVGLDQLVEVIGPLAQREHDGQVNRAGSLLFGQRAAADGGHQQSSHQEPRCEFLHSRFLLFS